MTDRYECFMVHAVEDGDDYRIVRDSDGVVVVEAAPYLGFRHTPAGAMWWSDPRHYRSYRPTGPDDWTGVDEERRAGQERRGPSHVFDDGPHLLVMTPGGVWNIDSRASNCALPYDYAHRCWIRHGHVPLVTVDKEGATCTAGAGSIRCGDYHGFLRAGFLVP